MSLDLGAVATGESLGVVGILVAGGGSIGKRDVRKLLALGVSDLFTTSPDGRRRVVLAKRYGIAGFRSVDEAVELKPVAALKCTRTTTHVTVTRRATPGDAEMPYQ